MNAVECAIAFQEKLAEMSAGVPDDRRLQFRIGVHVGDVAVRGGDLLGDGVNIAARLENLAEPGGICISGAAHEYVRKSVPVAFTDLGEQTLKNLLEPVRVYAFRSALLGRRTTTRALPLPDKPSIAVLPFTNMSGDPEQEYFADGMAEEIIAALSRIRSLFVIARNSSFSYREAERDVRQIASELGVRYVLVGSVRRAGQRVRVTAELVDGVDGGHIWADRYDSEVEDIFDLQDRLTEAIIGAILPNIRATEIERARRKRPDSLDAYDCVMKAMPAVWSSDPETATQALELLDRAMSLDPNYALAKSMASWCHAQQVTYLRSSDPQLDRDMALSLAEEAARLDSNDPLVLTTLGAAYTLARRLDRASTLIERALKLDPNSAWAWQRSGWIYAYRAQSELAIEHFQRGLRISPFDPINFNSYFGLGVAHFAAARSRTQSSGTRKAHGSAPVPCGPTGCLLLHTLRPDGWMTHVGPQRYCLKPTQISRLRSIGAMLLWRIRNTSIALSKGSRWRVYLIEVRHLGVVAATRFGSRKWGPLAGAKKTYASVASSMVRRVSQLETVAHGRTKGVGTHNLD